MRLFADDTAAYLHVAITKPAESQQLQDDLNILKDWEHEWDMEFNPSKCHVIRVTRSRSPLPTSYTLHDQTFEVVSCARYLGVEQPLMEVPCHENIKHSKQVHWVPPKKFKS